MHTTHTVTLIDNRSAGNHEVAINATQPLSYKVAEANYCGNAAFQPALSNAAISSRALA